MASPVALEAPRRDEALIARVAEGDRAALEALYDRYARTIYVFAAHVLDRPTAEEVVQEVFVILLRKAAQFDPNRGAFRIWLMAIARNRIVDELRRRRRERGATVTGPIEELLAETPDTTADVADTATARASSDGVLRALKTLPPEQRRVVLLAYFGGLTHAGIAKALGCPLGTVKKRIRLGMRKLRKAMAEEEVVAVTPATPRRD